MAKNQLHRKLIGDFATVCTSWACETRQRLDAWNGPMIGFILVRTITFLIALVSGLYAYDRLNLLVDHQSKVSGKPGPSTNLGAVAAGSRLPGGTRWAVQFVLSQIALAWAVWSSLIAAMAHLGIR